MRRRRPIPPARSVILGRKGRSRHIWLAQKYRPGSLHMARAAGQVECRATSAIRRLFRAASSIRSMASCLNSPCSGSPGPGCGRVHGVGRPRPRNALDGVKALAQFEKQLFRPSNRTPDSVMREAVIVSTARTLIGRCAEGPLMTLTRRRRATMSLARSSCERAGGGR